MANQWFRLYAEFAHDPKVQMLSEVDQRRYIMLLCFRCNGDVTLHETEIAFQLRISDEEWAETRARLIQRKLITKDNKPTAWDKRQYVSDSSAERVRRHREKLRNADVTLQKRPCNAVDTDTDTDTDTEKTKTTRAPRFDARAHLSSLGVPDQIAIDWIAHRRAKRATPTRTAIDRIAIEAEAAGLSLGDALGMCCERGWMGFKAYWLLDQHPAGQRRQTVTETRTETVATLTGRIRHANQFEERDITPGLLRIAK